MALSDIIDAIGRQTDAEIAALERDTADRIHRIREAAARDSAAAEAEAAIARTEDARIAADRIRNKARLGADRQLRAARDAIVQELFDMVHRRLTEQRTTTVYRDLLARLIAEATAALPTAEVLQVDRHDEGLARDIVVANGWDPAGALEVRADLETWGGVIAVCRDGRRVDNTLEERLARADPHIRRLVAELVPELGTRPM